MTGPTLGRMRILYLHQYFTTPSMRGGGRTYEFGRRLAAAGHEVHMLTSDKSGLAKAVPDGSSGWSISTEAGMTVHWTPIAYDNKMGFGERLSAFGKFAMLAGSRAIAVGGDVVLATSTPLTIAIPAVYASKRLGVPMVFEIRDLWPAVPIAMKVLRSPPTILAARTLERFAYCNAARIVALSPGIRDGVIATGYPPAKISVIPNGSDFDLFAIEDRAVEAFRSRHSWLGERPLIAYVGAISRANGVEWLVELAAHMRERAPELRFLIVGEGRDTEAVLALARQRGVLDRTLFYFPPVAKRAVPEIVRAASLAAVCFIDIDVLHTGSPNKAFDAFAAGTPVLMNFGGWLGDRVRQYGAGIVAGHRDLDVTADEIMAMLDSPEAIAAARAGARRLGREQFARDELARRLEQVLLEATTGREVTCPTG